LCIQKSHENNGELERRRRRVGRGGERGREWQRKKLSNIKRRTLNRKFGLIKHLK
jgi:hypothetical protein